MKNECKSAVEAELGRKLSDKEADLLEQQFIKASRELPAEDIKAWKSMSDEERAEAIVMVGAMPVKSAPDDSGTELFVLHEGTKVVIISSLRGWFEIRIADGHVGWVKTTQIERI